MSTVQRIAMGVIAMGVITTLILPGRQTVPVINAAQGFGEGILGTAMGTKRS